MTTDAHRRPHFSLRSLILFVALCGTGYGLWARWEPWPIAYEKSLQGPIRSSDEFRLRRVRYRDNDGTLRLSMREIVMHSDPNKSGDYRRRTVEYDYDLATGSYQLVQEHRSLIKGEVVEPEIVVDTSPLADRQLVCVHNFHQIPTSDTSLDAKLILRRISTGDNLAILDTTLRIDLPAAISNNGGEIVLIRAVGRLAIYRRRRPEYWWGVAWLPEFWLTLILSAALLWSLRRDMLNLKTAVEQ